MFKILKIKGDIDITIEISDEGKVTYSVGKNKTTFDLRDCDSFTYKYETTDEKVEITEEMIKETDEIEPWVWLVISKGEERLAYNNYQKETRRHNSYSEYNDKINILKADEDTLDMVLANIEKEAVKKAIQTLEPQQQELIMDLYYREIPVAHIAKRDGVDEAAIRNRRKRILKKIKKSLF